MGKTKKKETRTSGSGPSIAYIVGSDPICIPGYTSLDKVPEIVAAVRKVAEVIGAMTIHLMQNTADGDKRIINELSRAVDIEPVKNMTRQNWMEWIVMTMLLYGKGNAIVQPHTYKGLLESLEPIAAERVMFQPVGYRDYKVVIDGKEKNPSSVLHFAFNPDKTYPWKGNGLTVTLRDLAQNLRQAAATEKAFLSSEYKPSIIVKVDALTEEFSGPEGRQKLLESYVKPAHPGDPWLIPAEQFEVDQVKPLTLEDLAIKDTVELDRRMVAAIVGVPPFVVGVGNYNQAEWNAFISTKAMSITKNIAAEMTKKLILSPSWYWRFNVWSLLDYNLQQVSQVLLAGSDRGFVNGDEWRDRMNLPPAGLTEYKVLENYIPYDMSGQQSKLQGDA